MLMGYCPRVSCDTLACCQDVCIFRYQMYLMYMHIKLPPDVEVWKLMW